MSAIALMVDRTDTQILCDDVLDYLCASILRGIVDDQDISADAGLREHAVNTGRDVAPVVVAGNHDGHSWRPYWLATRALEPGRGASQQNEAPKRPVKRARRG